MIEKPGTARDIPDDVWKVSYSAFMDGFGLRYEVAIEFIARSIMRERESCAKVAEQTFVPCADYANERVAVAIRGRKERP